MATRALNPLAVGSLGGILYVLTTIAVVFYLLPRGWHRISMAPGSAVDTAILCVVDVAVLGGLIYLGLRWLNRHRISGLRAGIVVGVIGFYCLSLVALGFGGMFERSLANVPLLGLSLTIVIWLGLVGMAGSLYFRKNFESWLITAEGQGWFNATSYKASQGMRMRRGTMLCILLLAGCGIYTMLSRGMLRTAAGDAWTVSIPFAHGVKLTILNDLQFTLPILIAAISVWLSYRLVNYPSFADFLIATEAEMNKVSWVTRRRLYQDTIVVLTTVLLLTVYMFVMDIGWTWFLGKVGVLQMPTSETTRTLGPQDW
jgi:preprotein translocase SecE subunit